MADLDMTAPPTLRVAAPKPKMTIYYALLIIALLAMLTACLFMFLEIKRFGGFGAVKGKVTSVERRVPLLATIDGLTIDQKSTACLTTVATS
jgi:uncharacterized membrane protein